MYHYGELQWTPLNVITFGQSETDNIDRMITITGYFYIVAYNYLVKWTYEV
jgi:hypothetical protein